MELCKTKPAVFAVGETYQIMVPVKEACLMWVQVGGQCYYDEWQGILRSDTAVHRMILPMKVLDEAGEYILCARKIVARKPYFTETSAAETESFRFFPIREDQEKINIYHIADAHSFVEPVVKAAAWFSGHPDLLVMNGDIPNHSGMTEYFDNIYRIAERVTGVEVPVIFARGNHDCRGTYAERMGEYIPLDGQNTYYTFRLGPIWGLVLDCGEDKMDDHEEYGHTVCFHSFRRKETEFLRRVGETCLNEREDGVRYRLVVVHNPFTRVLEPPFDIERNIYQEWAKILQEQIRPDMMLCGHLHETAVYEAGGEMDHLGQPCSVVIGAKPLCLKQKERNEEEKEYIGTACILEHGEIQICFTDSDKKVRGIPYKIRCR